MVNKKPVIRVDSECLKTEKFKGDILAELHPDGVRLKFIGLDFKDKPGEYPVKKDHLRIISEKLDERSRELDERLKKTRNDADVSEKQLLSVSLQALTHHIKSGDGISLPNFAGLDRPLEMFIYHPESRSQKFIESLNAPGDVKQGLKAYYLPRMHSKGLLDSQQGFTELSEYLSEASNIKFGGSMSEESIKDFNVAINTMDLYVSEGMVKEPEDIKKLTGLIRQVPPEQRKNLLLNMGNLLHRRGDMNNMGALIENAKGKVDQIRVYAESIPKIAHSIWATCIQSLSSPDDTPEDFASKSVESGVLPSDFAGTLIEGMMDRAKKSENGFERVEACRKLIRHACDQTCMSGPAEKALKKTLKDTELITNLGVALCRISHSRDISASKYAVDFIRANKKELLDNNSNPDNIHEILAAHSPSKTERDESIGIIINNMSSSPDVQTRDGLILDNKYCGIFALGRILSYTKEPEIAEKAFDCIEKHTRAGKYPKNRGEFLAEGERDKRIREIREAAFEVLAFSLIHNEEMAGDLVRKRFEGVCKKANLDYGLLSGIWAKNDRKIPEYADPDKEVRSGQAEGRSIMVLEELSHISPDAAQNLYKNRGLRVFGRYSAPSLALVHKRDIEGIKPKYSGLIINPYDDHNGAFLNDRELTDSLIMDLGADICEAGSLFGVGRQLIRHAKRYGPLDFASPGGHGTYKSLQFGGEDMVSGSYLRLGDLQRLKKQEGVGNWVEKIVKPRFTCIMRSCSTGKQDDIPVECPLADELKHLIDTKTPSRESKHILVFAPEGDTSLENVDWDTQGQHLLFKRVDYDKNVHTGRFELKK